MANNSVLKSICRILAYFQKYFGVTRPGRIGHDKRIGCKLVYHVAITDGLGLFVQDQQHLTIELVQELLLAGGLAGIENPGGLIASGVVFKIHHQRGGRTSALHLLAQSLADILVAGSFLQTIPLFNQLPGSHNAAWLR